MGSICACFSCQTEVIETEIMTHNLIHKKNISSEFIFLCYVVENKKRTVLYYAWFASSPVICLHWHDGLGRLERKGHDLCVINKQKEVMPTHDATAGANTKEAKGFNHNWTLSMLSFRGSLVGIRLQNFLNNKFGWSSAVCGPYQLISPLAQHWSLSLSPFS